MEEQENKKWEEMNGRKKRNQTKPNQTKQEEVVEAIDA